MSENQTIGLAGQLAGVLRFLLRDMRKGELGHLPGAWKGLV